MSTVFEREVRISLASRSTKFSCHQGAGGYGTTQEIAVCGSRVITESIVLSSSSVDGCSRGTGENVSLLPSDLRSKWK